MLDYMINTTALTLGATVIALPVILLIRGPLWVRIVVGAVLGAAPSAFIAWTGSLDAGTDDHLLRMALGAMIGASTAWLVWGAQRNARTEPPARPWR
jgi:hypothetical protein